MEHTGFWASVVSDGLQRLRCSYFGAQGGAGTVVVACLCVLLESSVGRLFSMSSSRRFLVFVIPNRILLRLLSEPFSTWQVLYQDAPGEMLKLPSGQDAAVSIMFRTALFPHEHSRLRKVLPRPPRVFYDLSRAFREVLAVRSFLFPSLTEVLAREPQPRT